MCSDDQHKETMQALTAIEKCLQRREDDFQTVPVSDSQAFIVDYKDRHYLFAWSTAAVTLDAGSRGTFALPAESWTQLAFQPNIQLKTSGQGTTPVQITLLATDNLINPYVYASTSGSGAGLALESGGNLAAIETVIAKLLFDGNQYLKTTILNGTNQVNVAPNGALYTVQATNNGSVPSGAGNTVIKAGAGNIATLVVTTAGTGTGNVLIYDNATTNSGTVLFAFPATVAVAQTYQIYGWAKVGMTAQNVLNGPVFTVFYS